MPKEILGVDGYLQREQPEIESLSLNTGAPTDRDWLLHGGDYIIPPPAPLMLDGFRRLRSFSWTGARLASELESLRVFLAANRSILETLELDFIDRNSMNHACQTRLASDDPRVFTTHVLPLSPDPSINSFPALTTLSLSAVCLPLNLDATVLAFDFGRLRALKLHRCKDTHLLLRAIVHAAQSLKLESLDLMMEDFATKQDWGGSGLTAFLQSFNSLQQLYLSITPSGEITTEQYFESILCHASTMKRLVYHEMTLHQPDSLYPSEDKNLTLATLDLGYGPTGAMHRFMQQSGLESFGCYDSLSQLRKILESCTSTQSLKLLHIRRSKEGFEPLLRDNMIQWTVKGVVEPVGPENHSAQAIANFELFDFVRWAFGSRGLSKLRILAFGDFSYDGRFEDKRLLFCRQRIGSPHGFRLASRENVISLGGIDEPLTSSALVPMTRSIQNGIVVSIGFGNGVFLEPCAHQILPKMIWRPSQGIRRKRAFGCLYRVIAQPPVQKTGLLLFQRTSRNGLHGM